MTFGHIGEHTSTQLKPISQTKYSATSYKASYSRDSRQRPARAVGARAGCCRSLGRDALKVLGVGLGGGGQRTPITSNTCRPLLADPSQHGTSRTGPGRGTQSGCRNQLTGEQTGGRAETVLPEEAGAASQVGGAALREGEATRRTTFGPESCHCSRLQVNLAFPRTNCAHAATRSWQPSI